MPSHKNLTGTDLHEPKGVASASSGTVYVADGAGSGSWSTVGAPASWVLVSTANDLPTPVSNVITLADDTVYFIDTDIDLGDDRIVMGSNSQLIGHGASLSTLTSTTTGALITATGSHQIHRIAVTVTSGSVLALTGGAYESAYYSEFQVTSCTSVGSLTGWYSFVWKSGAVVSATTSGISFSGSCSIAIFELVSFLTSTGTAVNLGTATFDTFTLHRCGWSGATGTHVAVAASSANINSGGIGRIILGKFNTSATVSTGLTVADARWDVLENYGLADTGHSGQGYITGNATATSFGGTGDGNEVVAAFGTSFNDSIERSFTISNAGRFTYDGAFPKTFVVTANIYATQSSGADRVYTFYIAKGGTKIASSVNKRTFSSGNPGALSVQSIVELTSGDYVELYVQAETAATNLTIETCSICVVGV